MNTRQSHNRRQIFAIVCKFFLIQHLNCISMTCAPALAVAQCIQCMLCRMHINVCTILCSYSGNNNQYYYYPFFMCGAFNMPVHSTQTAVSCKSKYKYARSAHWNTFNANFVANNCTFDVCFRFVSDCQHSSCRMPRFLYHILLKLRSISNSVCK